MKNDSHQESGDLRKTLEYAEAVSLIVEQRKLDQHLGSIKKQLGALKRLSRATVDVARSDILSKN
jgi:AmiR/NasT family two-component response regulator